MKIAICTPSRDDVKAGFCFALAHIAVETSARHEVVLLNERLPDVAKSRNYLVTRALAHKADYLMWIDSDIVLPVNAILRLLNYKREVVGCTYRLRTDMYALAHQESDRPHIDGGLREVKRLPGGAVLVAAHVYQERADTWYHNTDATPEDWYFCDWVRLRSGRRVWLDSVLSSQIRHLGEHAYVMTDME